MTRAQQMLAIDESLTREERQRIRRDLDDALALEARGRDEIAGQFAVCRIVRAQRKQLVESGITHVLLQTDGGGSIFLSAPRSSRAGFLALNTLQTGEQPF
jgi:hypothetical protein